MKIKDELQKLKRLKNLIENTSNKNVRYFLTSDYLSLKEFVINTFAVNEQLLGIESYELLEEVDYNDDKTNKNIFKLFEFNFETIDEITQKLHEIYMKFPIKMKKEITFNQWITQKEANKLLKEFFSQLGSDVLEAYQKMLKNDNIKLVREEEAPYNGLGYDITYADSPRILLLKKEESDIFHLCNTLAHEMGHCYSYLRNKTNRPKYYYNFLIEVPSLVFEKLFDLFLMKNGYEEVGASLLLEWKRLLFKFNAINCFVNDVYKDGHVSLDKDEIGKLCLDDIAYLQAFYSLDDDIYTYFDALGANIYNYTYALSDVVANNLINKYLQNEKEGLKEFKDFITTMYQYTLEENLERYGKDLTSTKQEMSELQLFQKKKYYL